MVKCFLPTMRMNIIMNNIQKKWSIRRLIHPYSLCNTLDLNYRWRWKSQDNIKKLLKIPQDSIGPLGKQMLQQSVHNTVFDQITVCHGAKLAYLSLYEDFYNNVDLVDANYCDVSLGYFLNDLQDYIVFKDEALKTLSRKEAASWNLKYNSIHHPPIDHIENAVQVDILGSWLTTGLVFNHDKILGTCSMLELKHFIVIGAIGPEVPSMWNQIGIKQMVRVQYNIDGFIDIWDFERDVMVDKQLWQLNNINGLIIH